MEVAILLDHPSTFQCVSRSLRGIPQLWASGAVHICGNWDEFSSLCACGRVQAGFFDPGLAGSSPKAFLALPEIIQIGKILGREGAILMPPPGEHSRTIGQTLQILGFPFVLLPGEDLRKGRILRTLAASEILGLFQAQKESVVSEHGPEAFQLTYQFLSVFSRNPSLQTLAFEARSSHRSLRRNHRREGIPTPQECLRWAQLLFAVSLFQRGISSSSRISRIVGYEDQGSLNRSSKDLIGHPIREGLKSFTTAGAFQVFLDRLNRRTKSGGISGCA